MKTNGVLIVLVVLLVIWNAVLSLQIFTEDSSNPQKEEINTYQVSGFSTDLSVVANEIQPSCISVISHSTISSGFIYRNEEKAFYVVTACHGLSDDPGVTVVLDNDIRYIGEVIGKDIYSDTAVIRVECDLQVPTVKCGDSDLLKNGEFVLISGTPGSLELRNSATVAMVSSNLRTISNTITVEAESYSYYLSVLQLSGDVDTGYSGAGIFNMNGECMGIISMKSTSQVIGLPINEVKTVADRLINGEEVNKIQFGIRGSFVKDLETYEKSALSINLETTSGFYISQIQPGSLAMNAGVRQGDIILSINGTALNDNSDYLSVCYSNPSEVVFSVQRGTDILELKGIIND